MCTICRKFPQNDDKGQKRTMKKYRIELTEKQLRLIAMCVEDCHRFAAGQTGMTNMSSNLFIKGLRFKLAELRYYIAPCDWAGNGATNEYQRKFVAQTYPIYREIYHNLAIESGKESVYTSPTPRSGLGGEPPVITTIDTESDMSSKNPKNDDKEITTSD